MGDNEEKLMSKDEIKDMLLKMDPDRFHGRMTDFKEIREQVEQDKASSKS